MRQSALVLSTVKLKLLLFALLSISYLFFTPHVHAQTYQNSITAPNVSSDVEQNQHTYVQTMFFDILSAGSCLMTGIDPINSKGCLVVDPETRKFSYSPSIENTQQPGGAFGVATTMIGQFYDVPIHSGSYVNYVASNFGIAEKAYADQGFDQLSGVLQVWTIFRNLSYLFFVLIFVLIGMGVMLRIKIDPRTVMSIQNQIPRLIVGLVLITFSYAIAGFMVDLMWTTTYLTIRLAGTVKPVDGKGNPLKITDNSGNPITTVIKPEKVTQDLLSSPIGFFDSLMSDVKGGVCYPVYFGDKAAWDSKCQTGIVGVAQSIGGTIGGVIGTMLAPFNGDATTKSCASFTGGINVQSCVHEAFYGVLKFISGIIMFIIIAIALLITLFKIWWQLLKSFAYVIIYTAIAPIYIAAGLIPGSTTNFSSWIRGLVANLLVYPATVAFFLGAKIFLRTFTDATNYSPPLTGNPSAVGGFGYIVAFAIIMVAPELINMLRDALKSPASKYIAPAITRGLGAGAALPGAVMRGAWGRAFKFDPSGHGIGGLNVALHSFQRSTVSPTSSRWVNNPVMRRVGWAAAALAGKP